MNEMRKQQFTEAHSWVRAELDRCVNFWLKNGMDPEFGGVYTCLDRTGKIYSTDKSVWMQGRCGWIFAHLCTVYGVKQEWLDAPAAAALILWSVTALITPRATVCILPLQRTVSR